MKQPESSPNGVRTREAYVSRLKTVCAEINAQYDVDGLSRAFPSRVQAVKDAEGDRIAK